ncbi:DMT family transporter [Bacillus timonensis]|uniref:DMT family transporter n=1 Tax=Bacillus timonensis TaxID=1033734 RepID=A0A4S3PI12_9BACI|nr:DMT family transporter [Bacillus timonensis]THE08848.1 DMT family transporter [Bacillus timonensis]
MKKYYILLFLIFANLFWAGNFVFGKYVVTELAPLQMTFARWLIAFFLLIPIAYFVEHPTWKSVWKEWKILLTMAVLGVVGYNSLLYIALQYTTPVNASLVNAINPVVIFLLSALFLKERISFRRGLGLFISLFGVLLVLTNGHLQQIFHINYNQGDLLMLVAILAWTFYSLIGKKLRTVPPISATAVSVFLGLLILFPFIIFSGIHYPLHNKKVVIGLLYFGIFPSVGSFIFWNVALRHIDASQAGVYMNLIVVFTVIISFLLGQQITLIQIIGGILVFIGVYLTTKKERNENVFRLTKGVISKNSEE